MNKREPWISLQVIMGVLFSLAIVLASVYVFGLEVFKLPLSFVLLLGCMAIVAVLSGAAIAAWLIRKRSP